MKKAMAALILFLMETLLFYLYEMPLEAWAYSSVFILLIFGGWIILDEVQQRKKYKQLKNIQKEAEVYLETEHFGKPENAVEKEYQNLAEMLGRQWENARQEARCQISEANRYYIRWSHQIKTPIAAMRLLQQVQRNRLEAGDEITIGVEDAESMQVQAELEKELFDIEQYVNMALQYQRVNTPGNDYVLEKLRLDDIVREVIHKYAGLMVRAHIPLQYEGTDVMVTTDAKWVAFALEQILSNAIKYSRAGQQIVIETVPEENVDYLKIADHGIGIRAEDMSRVFEKGYTGYNGHADKKSTGIGLYLCRLVLTKLGHTIRMESVQGEGTTVWIGFQK